MIKKEDKQRLLMGRRACTLTPRRSCYIDEVVGRTEEGKAHPSSYVMIIVALPRILIDKFLSKPVYRIDCGKYTMRAVEL